MPLSDRTRLARNLKVAREAARVSQTDAGEAVGKTRGTIVNWEHPKNRAEPSSDELEILARLYHVTTQELRFAELMRPSRAVVAPPKLTGKGRRGPYTADDASGRGRAEGE